MLQTEALVGPLADLPRRRGAGVVLWLVVLLPGAAVLLPPALGPAMGVHVDLLLFVAGLLALVAAGPLLLRQVVYGTRVHGALGYALAWSGLSDLLAGLPVLLGAAELGPLALLIGRCWALLPLLLIPCCVGGLRLSRSPLAETLSWMVLGLLGVVASHVLPLADWWTVAGYQSPVPRLPAIGVAASTLLGVWAVQRVYRQVGSRIYWWNALGFGSQAGGLWLDGFAEDGDGLSVLLGRLLVLLGVVEVLIGQALYQIDLLRDRQVAITDLQRSLDEREEHLARLERYAADLERSKEEIESYTYAASHDLQEPLRSVQFYCAMLLDRYGERLDDRARQYVGFAVDGAQRMGRLIAAILDYSRVQRQGLHFRRLNVADCLRMALDNLGSAVDESGLEVVVNDLPVVTVDRTHLTRLLQNLLANAMKYNDSGTPEVRVSAERRPDEWVISLTDNGIGIDPAYHERIFGVFKRLHKRDVYPGSGVGLSICQRIVERRGGHLWVEFTLGAGATFSFSIPDQVPIAAWDMAQDESDI